MKLVVEVVEVEDEVSVAASMKKTLPPKN